MSEKDRQWFLGQLQDRAKKQGKKLNLIGKAAFEQRLKDGSEDSFSPRPPKGTKLRPPQELTPKDKPKATSGSVNPLKNQI